jgi:pimeloyl-ACP methyl ester carboxylesterase
MISKNMILTETANNTILYYEELRSKNTEADWLLLIHGAGGSTRTWKKQKEALSAFYNVLIIDLPGHGQSKHRDIDFSYYDFDIISNKVWEVVDHLKISAVHLLGVSLGAIIAMQMRELRPLNVASLVLAGAIVRLDTKLKLISSFSLSLAKIVGFHKFYQFAAFLALPKKNHKKSREIFIRESKHLTNDEFKKWTALYGKHLNETLRNIYEAVTDIPTILIMGGQDHFFLKQAKRYVERHKNARLKIVEKCGHIVNLEKGEAFNKLCLQFLKSIKSDAVTPGID